MHVDESHREEDAKASLKKKKPRRYADQVADDLDSHFSSQPKVKAVGG